MSESVEQAALRRAELGDLPAPWGSVLAAMEASERLADTRYRNVLARCEAQAEDIVALHEENAELRDAMVALGNRIEAATRGWQPRREEGYCRYCEATRTFTEGKCDVCDTPIVGVGRTL